MIRRSAVVLTLPLWGLAIFLFCLVSGARSSWHWFCTGDWLLPEELPPFWMDRVESAVAHWLETS